MARNAAFWSAGLWAGAAMLLALWWAAPVGAAEDAVIALEPVPEPDGTSGEPKGPSGN